MAESKLSDAEKQISELTLRCEQLLKENETTDAILNEERKSAAKETATLKEKLTNIEDHLVNESATWENAKSEVSISK